MRWVFYFIFLLPINSFAQNCPSKATLKVTSSGYSGAINVELRKGNRPGSRLIDKRSMYSTGTEVFNNVCTGTYFFAFGTHDSDSISVTRYFKIRSDGNTYNNPIISVFYSKSTTDGSQLVVKAKKTQL